MQSAKFCELRRSRSPIAEAADLKFAECQCKSDREHHLTACSPTSRGVPLRTGRLRVRILPRGPTFALRATARQAIWNVNRTSEPGLGANECVPSRQVAQVHGIPPFYNARVAQREQSAL
jgi:hypothetical protein